MQQQFAFVFHPMETGFDGIYLAATLLNPLYRKLLNEFKVTIAKKFLLAMMSSNIETTNLSDTSMSQSESQDFAEAIASNQRTQHSHHSHTYHMLQFLQQHLVNHDINQNPPHWCHQHQCQINFGFLLQCP